MSDTISAALSKRSPVSPDPSSLSLSEGEYTAKVMTAVEENLIGHRLRHKIFAEELGWVPASPDSLEIDSYDAHSVFFGVFRAGALLAYVRVVLPKTAFMIENEFFHMVSSDHLIRKEEDTVEVSRLCVAPEARNSIGSGNFGIHSISLLLFKACYLWFLERGVRYIYIVVAEKVFRLLNAKCFTYRQIGPQVVMPDGLHALAARMDLREFEHHNLMRRPRLIAWFMDGTGKPGEENIAA